MMNAELIEQPFVMCGKTKVLRNTRRWRVATNRHPTLRNNNWGWIEGSPGNICWSNDDPVFNSKMASDVVAEHNAWLDDQRSLTLKIIDAREAVALAQLAADSAKNIFDVRLAAWAIAETKLRELTDQIADEPPKAE